MDRIIKFKKDKTLTKNNIKKLKEFADVNTIQDLVDSVPSKHRKGKTKKAKKNKALKYLVQQFNNEVGERRKQIKKDILKDREKIKKYNKGEIKKFSLDVKSPEELKHAIDLLSQSRKKTLMNIDGRLWTLNERNRKKYLKAIESIWIKERRPFNSFAEYIQEVALMENIEFSQIRSTKKTELIEGAFFNYTHKLEGFDLEDIGIYENVHPANYENSCFIKALIQHNIEKDKIDSIKRVIKSRDLPQKKIKEIAEKFDLYITVKRLEANKHLRKYGNKKNKHIDLCLMDNHYFINKKINITSYAIKNYDDIKHIDEWWRIVKKNKYYQREDKFITSGKVVKLLLDNKDKLLERICKSSELYGTIYFDKVTEIKNLDADQCIPNPSGEEFIEDAKYKKKKKKTALNIFADFETTARNGTIHKPYLCAYSSGDIKKIFYGEDCGEEMLKSLSVMFPKYDNFNLIFHNAKYDFRFIYKYIWGLNYCPRDSSGFITASGRYYYAKGKYIEVCIKDSYNIISKPLSKFGKMFDLKQEKEKLPYNLYSEKSVKEKYINIEKCKKHASLEFKRRNIKPYTGDEVDDEDERKKWIDDFISNAKKWKCIENDKINIIKYSAKYCLIDCQVLEKGYNKFRDWILKALKLDINDYYTIASIANAYLTKEDVYNGVYKLGGVAREFIQKCMVGGRTMLSENKKYYSPKSETLGDFDATSLYPSAMYRLKGYPLGKPKVLNKDQINDDFLKNTSAYFIEIKIKKVGKYRKFPLMSRVKEDGIREFTNEMEGETLHVDNIALEDLIKFQNVEYEIVRGYYFDEGYNKTISNVMDFLFNKRLEMKKLKNPIQEVYKLIMNSAYGKTLLKPIDTKNKMIHKKKLEYHLSKYYNHIKEVVDLTGGDYVHVREYKPIIDHFNNCHCGVLVLSMSKRIMNEVMTLAEDKGINIYYQDTDSMHIVNNGIDPLAEEYKNIYDRELVGKNLGQFHTDFESDKIKSEPYAVESYFLGKKCYIDKLEGKDENGETVHDYHIRMKGVSSDAIKYYSSTEEIELINIYKKLFEGEEIEFDLCCGGKKAMFEFNPDMSILSLPSFHRKIKF